MRLGNVRPISSKPSPPGECGTRPGIESSGVSQGAAPRLPDRVEWLTILLALGIYLSFGLITWFHASLPWWAILGLGAYVVALQSSLQHEVAHGHPTPWPGVNRMLVFPVLWLWLPFETYRDSHLAHHRDADLTDPNRDSESWYVAPEEWQRFGRVRQALAFALNSALGRMLLGPPRCLYRAWRAGLASLAAGDHSAWRIWSLHALAVTSVLIWTSLVCGMPVWQYLVLIVYPACAMMQLRSFLEHRADPEVGRRSVIVEAAWPFALLYLNNNLHALHHAQPGLAWYRLPGVYALRKESLLKANGGYFYSGYADILWRFLVWPKEHPLHPGMPAASDLAPSPSLPARTASTPAAPAQASALARKP